VGAGSRRTTDDCRLQGLFCADGSKTKKRGGVRRVVSPEVLKVMEEEAEQEALRKHR
jgi:hypothetical protein